MPVQLMFIYTQILDLRLILSIKKVSPAKIIGGLKVPYNALSEQFLKQNGHTITIWTKKKKKIPLKKSSRLQVL